MLMKKYKVLEGLEQWVTDTFGRLPDPFHLLIIGKRKNGKTTLTMQLCKSLARRYKVFYSSREEGDSITIQEQFIRHSMAEVTGNFFLGDGFGFTELVDKLKQTYYKIIVIDSLDYMKLTKQQYIKLVETFPTKSFIIVCWGERKGKDWVADDYYANQIAYMVGAVVGVADFKANCIGRYGPTEEHVIWDRRPEGQLKLKI